MEMIVSFVTGLLLVRSFLRVVCDMLGCLYCCSFGFGLLCISIVAHGFHLQYRVVKCITVHKYTSPFHSATIRCPFLELNSRDHSNM